MPFYNPQETISENDSCAILTKLVRKWSNLVEIIVPDQKSAAYLKRQAHRRNFILHDKRNSPTVTLEDPIISISIGEISLQSSQFNLRIQLPLLSKVEIRKFVIFLASKMKYEIYLKKEKENFYKLLLEKVNLDALSNELAQLIPDNLQSFSWSCSCGTKSEIGGICEHMFFYWKSTGIKFQNNIEQFLEFRGIPLPTLFRQIHQYRAKQSCVNSNNLNPKSNQSYWKAGCTYQAILNDQLDETFKNIGDGVELVHRVDDQGLNGLYDDFFKAAYSHCAGLEKKDFDIFEV